MTIPGSKLSSASVQSALSLIQSTIFRTPVFRVTDILSEQSPIRSLLDLSATKDCRIDLYIKCENKQRTGSFKFRGALHTLRRRTDEQLKRGIVSYSTGNHAKALALALHIVSAERGYHIPAKIVMSTIAEPSKVAAVEEAGARVVQYGHRMVESRQEATRIAQAQNSILISSADDQDIVLGHGTVLPEFLSQMRELGYASLDEIVLPCGGGGLLAGCAIAAQDTSVNIMGSEPRQGGPNPAAGIAVGARPTKLESHTIADSLRAVMSPLTWEIVRQKRYVTGVYSEREEDIRRAMALFVQSTSFLIEPGSAVPLATVLLNPTFRERYRKRGDARPWRVGVVLSGGNVTARQAHEIIASLA